jgi:hypothetical protein
MEVIIMLITTSKKIDLMPTGQRALIYSIIGMNILGTIYYPNISESLAMANNKQIAHRLYCQKVKQTMKYKKKAQS